MQTKIKRYDTCYLLSLSRFPEQFYGRIYDLEGRSAVYDNPGVSLRSYVLAGTNPLNEFIDVSGRMLDIIAECEEFCSNLDIALTIKQALISEPYDIVERVILAANISPTALNEILKRLGSMCSRVDTAWTEIKKTGLIGDPVRSSQIDLASASWKEFKQALFEIKAYSSELVESLDHTTKGKA